MSVRARPSPHLEMCPLRSGSPDWPSPGTVDTRLCGFPVCLLRGDVADSGVDPPPIVIAFDVSEQLAPRCVAIGIVALVDEFGFQRAEETLHRRIVPAIALAAHRLRDGGGLQDLAVVASGILAAAIGVMHETRRGAAPLDRHGQRGYGKFGTHMIAHRPANNFAGEQVEDHGSVALAVKGALLGGFGPLKP